MTIHGKIQFNEAIIVDEKLLTNLEEVILSYYSKVTYECKLHNEDMVEFESLKELLNYKNIKSRKIVMLKVKFDYNEIYFEPTLSKISSYSHTVFGIYKMDDSDKSILFSKKVEEILENGRRSKWYTFVTKFSMMYFLMFILVLSIGNAIYSIVKEGVMGGNIYTINSLNLSLMLAILLLVISIFLAKCRDALLPPISFMIGEQVEEIEKQKNLFDKIFWGIIVAFVVSLIVAKIA